MPMTAVIPPLGERAEVEVSGCPGVKDTPIVLVPSLCRPLNEGRAVGEQLGLTDYRLSCGKPSAGSVGANRAYAAGPDGAVRTGSSLSLNYLQSPGG